MEEKAKGNTSVAIKKLMGLQPKTVIVLQADGTQRETAIEEVLVNDVILVKPGEKIAVDGLVISGSSYVDESMLSGEPVPVLKNPDEKVFAGTINQKGSFRFRAVKVGKDTMLAQIIRTLSHCDSGRAPRAGNGMGAAIQNGDLVCRPSAGPGRPRHFGQDQGNINRGHPANAGLGG